MADEQTAEERLAYLERELAKLRRDIETEKLQQVKVNAQQSDVSSALIARTDDILVEHLKRLERMQLDAVSRIMGELRISETRAQTTNSRLDNIDVRLDGIEANLVAASEIAANHKEAIERIETKVDVTSDQLAQILAILTGEQKRND